MMELVPEEKKEQKQQQQQQKKKKNNCPTVERQMLPRVRNSTKELCQDFTTKRSTRN